MSSEIEAWREVIRTVDVAPDLQVHVSALTVDGVQFVEIRNWIPSAESYGRGVVFPREFTGLVIKGLTDMLQG